MCWSVNILAHPTHTSFAEIRLNQASQTLEIALRVIPEDLESILSNRAGKPFSLNNSETADRQIIEYLWEAFQVINEHKKRLELRWVGKEVTYAGAWLYFEMPLNNAQKLTLNNRVLLDWNTAQINTVKFINDDSHKMLTFENFAKPQLIWKITEKSATN
ncbi:MAG: DUF6702 family protein [Pseudomonadota bacterium]